MDAMPFDRRITLRRATSAPNGFNEPVLTWSDLATVSARWRDASANERLRAAEVGALLSAIFEIRWSPTVANIDERDRLMFDGREYDITGVTDIGRREKREIRAVVRSDQ